MVLTTLLAALQSGNTNTIPLNNSKYSCCLMSLSEKKGGKEGGKKREEREKRETEREREREREPAHTHSYNQLKVEGNEHEMKNSPPALVGPKQCLISCRVGLTPGAENKLLLQAEKGTTRSSS